MCSIKRDHYTGRHKLVNSDSKLPVACGGVLDVAGLLGAGEGGLATE